MQKPPFYTSPLHRKHEELIKLSDAGARNATVLALEEIASISSLEEFKKVCFEQKKQRGW